MVSESFDLSRSPFLSRKPEILNEERTLDKEFIFPLSSPEFKAVKSRISLLRRKNNEIHSVHDDVVELASNVRKQMGRFVVKSFLDYARDTGVLPSRQSVFTDHLPEDSVEGIEEFFRQSYRPDSGIPRKLWDNRWLCALSNGLKHAMATGNIWIKNRLEITKEGLLTYTYHLDPLRKDHFPSAEDLTVEAMSDTYPSIGKVHLVDDGKSRGLLTHATRTGNMREIWSSGFVAPYRHIRPISLSEGVASLPYSDKVIIFDPNVLRKAGFALMRYDENPIDAHEILEVREPLPIPLFLASGVYDTARLHPEAAKGRAYVWSLDEPSGAFGKNELFDLQRKIETA